MHWIVLIVSGLFEAVWATALGRSAGLTRLWPTATFFVALVISMGGLAYAMRELPTGSSYAIWVGIGATGAVVYAMLTGAEAATLAKIVCIIAIVGGVVGLKLVS
ncbi:DMT family transporter [Gordonia hydrophobica]|uniref:SMR family transporter n=1 Tax=Gordonia hydrophobica TaxID=40516 RepID=A0ABZ2TXK8_9ACTN|nr:SMR family transporter [Gordonia hydrophobica]MBM7366419.1 quaternary ammonium compound-resistance protein SugE [Gordonia hydrophobica]